MNSGTVVIGLGNPLMGDDGLGIVVARQLLSRTDLPDGVQVVDGGTWGLNLLPVIEDAERVLLVDAIDMAEAPGTLIRLSRERLPRYLATKISPHQVDLRDVLALAELRGTLPDDTTAMGLQPQIVALGTALSPLIAGRMEELMSAVLDHLRAREPACTK